MTTESLSAIPLDGIVRLAGALFTAGVSIYVLIAKKPPPIIFDQLFFSHTREMIAVVIGVFISLTWGLLGNSRASPELATIAVISTSFGFIAFFWVVRLVEKAPSQKGKQNGTLLLFAYVIYSILISWGLTAAVIFLSVLVLNPSNPDAISVSKQANYRVILTIAGTRNTTSNSDVPFQISSGQVNFGCEESRPLSVTFPLPPNSSLVGAPSAHWKNVSNSSAHQENVVVAEGRVIASGTIRGLDYQNFALGIRNCPGGGHGELIVSGYYRTLTTSSEPRSMTIASNLSSSSTGPVKVTLPTETELTISSIRVSVIEEAQGDKQPEIIDLTPQVRSASTPSGKVRATLDLQLREVLLERGSKVTPAGA